MNQSPSIARKEIVFVFDNLTDWQTLVAAAPEGAEVVVLDGNQDGLQQIAAYLNGRSGIDAIHLLSHGSGGTAELGNLSLSTQNIGQYSQTLDAIGATLASDGDILIYGCYSGKGPQGAALLGELARLTQADIAASDNATGAADQGGDWQLELHVGEVGSASLSASAYRNLLVTPSDQGFNSESPRYITNAGDTIAGLTYSMVSPTAGEGAKVALTESSNTSITGGGDLGMMFNYDGATIVPGPVDARIASADGTAFRIVSMEIDTGNDLGTSSDLTITGYRDGVAVAADSFNTGIFDSAGSVAYAKNGVPTGFGGTLTFNNAWNYIDEIRITGSNTIIVIDDLDFEPGIPPDSTPPTVTGVSSSTLNGTYKVGSAISVQVNFSENVFVDNGTPQLTLETGTTDRTINYASGSGTSTLTFSYTVQAGDTSADLDSLSTSALALNGGSISDAAGNAATLTLPFPGAANSLGANKNIVIDGVVPTVSSVNSNSANDTYKIGDAISVQINFSEAVTVNGTPQLTLETGSTDRTINYASGSGTSTLTFSYTVQAGDTSADLDYLANSALALNGGTIRDAAGNDATLTLPLPGVANSLGANKNIVIDGVVPTVSSVNSNSANGTYKIGDAISVQINFSEAVTVNGTPQLTLETGTTDRAINYASGSGTSSLTFNYTVQAGDISADLDFTSTAALSLAGATLRDTAGNDAVLTLSAPGSAGSLGANKNIVIDGVAPTLSITSGASTLKIGDTTTITFTFSEDPGSSFTWDGSAGDVAVSGGTLSAITGSGLTRTATFTPTPGTNAGTASITVASDSYIDIAGNGGSSGVLTGLTYDTLAPAVSAPTLNFASDSGISSTDSITSVSTPEIEGSAEAFSTVTLYDTDGSTVLGSTAADVMGNWSITSVSLSEGTHFLSTRVTDMAGNTSLASSALVLTIDTSVATPSAPDLLQASDSGISPFDNITNVTTPTLTGTADIASSVTLYDSDGVTVLGTALADGGGVWSIASNALAEGTHTLTAKATDVAGNVSTASAGLTITIDATPPAAASAPNLDAGSDSGASDSDNITHVSTPIINGTAEANSTVTLYDTGGTTVLGITAANSLGDWSITSSTLTQGTHNLTIKTTDIAGNVSAASAALSVTVDSDAPVFSSASVNGSTLVLSYTDVDTLDAAGLLDPATFTVMVGQLPNAVTSAAVNALGKTVTLTLATPVAHGQVVTVAYDDPSPLDDVDALQDLAGNDAATLAATAVTNTTPAPNPGTPTTPTDPVPVPVDGVPVTTTPGDGGTTIITIPVILPTRPDSPNSPNAGLADIPLVKGRDGHSILEVSLPVGVALQAQGLPNPVSGNAAQTELGLRMERSAGGDADLINNAQAFLATLDPTTPLTIQTIIATVGAGFNPNVPLVISGSALSGDGKQAVILDARALPSGTTIQVDNVDFLAVVGAVRITGGAGQNMASGDGAAQYIVLGADDDIIHGGGGNDTVGSKGGDDKVYGDAGNDIVFGGAGNDQLSGGSGSDRLNGGTGFDVAIQEGKRTDYTVVLDGAGIKLTHIASGVSDWLVDVEQVRFETGPGLTIAHSAAEEAAAFLFQQWMGRDLTQSEGAVIQTLDGLSALQVAELFAQVFPQQAGGRTAQQLLEGMAGAGAIRVDAPRETAYVGDAGDNSFSPTPGLAWSINGGAGIDTIALPATLAQMHVEASDQGYTLQRMTDGAMLELMNVERLTLSDTKLALDLDGHAGQAAKLIGAVAGAAFLDNKPLVGEVIRALDAGISAQSLAQLGLQLLGANTPGQVTQLLWTHVVGSAATPAQLQPFVAMLAQGVTVGELAVLASNLDLHATRIDLVGLAATGIEFA